MKHGFGVRALEGTGWVWKGDFLHTALRLVFDLMMDTPFALLGHILLAIQ